MAILMFPLTARRRLTVAAGVVALSVGLTACGGASNAATSSSPTTTAPTSSGSRAGFSAFESCLSKHGIPASALDFSRGFRPGGTTGSTTSGTTPTHRTPPSLPKGVTEQQFRSATQACRADLPNGGAFGGGAGGFNSAQFAAYRNCLSEHGVKLPTGPAGTSSSTSVPAGGRGNFANNPTYQKAAKACAALRPKPTTDTTTTTTPSA